MKKYLPLLISILIITITFGNISNATNKSIISNLSKIQWGNINGVDVENITFNDSCYKGTNLSCPLEWWYFDAMFQNGYSVEFHINIGAANDIGVISPMINVYKEGNLIFHNDEFLYLNHFQSYEDKPIIKLDEKKIINGFIDKDGKLIFYLNYSIDNCSIDLKFEEITQGWKSKIIDLWWWGVLMPNSKVTGSIELDNNIVEVQGNGYLEHAWDGKIPMVWGWYWGKFIGNNMSIIWSEIFKNPWDRYLIMVLNEDHGSYYNIPYKNITIHLKDYQWNDGWIIPTSFNFEANTNDIKINLQAKSITIIHQISLLSFNYWRYHVNIVGTIQLGNNIEYIDNIQIMDLTRFY